MKQASRWFLCCTLAAALTLTGCGGGNSGSSSGSVSGSTSVGSSAAQSAAWRTGLGVLTETTGTDRAGNIHTVAAAVLLDADGKLASMTPSPLKVTVNPTTGAHAPFDVQLDLSSITQYGTAFSVARLSQDGYASGELTAVNVAADGTLAVPVSLGLCLGVILLGKVLSANMMRLLQIRASRK